MATKTKKPIRKQQQQQPRAPLWKGPLEGGDGITFSLLSRFIVCRERFRLQVVEGLKEQELRFPHALEYGSLWHEAEEAFAGGNDWKSAVNNYANKLREEYPADDREIAKWVALCLHQFPEYINHYKSNSMERKREPILEEVAFKVPYALPSGRVVLLRGKWDCVFQYGKRSIYLQENKTKGNIDEEGITRTVDQNLQSMLYQIALRKGYDANHGHIETGGEYVECGMGLRIKGTLYNVVRRPLSDKHAPRQKKKETPAQFYKRAGSELVRANPSYWFKRWRVEISGQAIERYRRITFDPLLEQLCDWWEWIQIDPFNPWRPRTEGGGVWRTHNGIHWQSPWGVYNSLASGWRGDYFDLLTTGSRVGLNKVDSLFPELDDP